MEQVASRALNRRHKLFKQLPDDIGVSINKLLEVVFLPLVIPVLLYILNVKDIFLLESGFPWLIIIPIVVAVRYGTWIGLLNLSVLAVALLSYTFFYQEDLFNKGLNILSGNFLIVILIGELLHSWKHKFEEIQQEKIDCLRDNNKIEQELQLLHIAYSQLEENLVTTTQSVTRSLRLLEVSLQPPLDSKQQVKVAIRKLREILDQYEWLEESVFYYINEKGMINPVPLANKAVLSKDLHKDILISKVIETKRAVVAKKIGNKSLKAQKSSRLQAAIPLIDSHQRLWGVMAVVRITPSVFIQQNLNLLSLLCAYVANLLRASEHPLTSAEALRLETSTAIDIALNSVNSVFLIKILIPFSANHNRYKAFFIRKIKGVSRIWQLQKKHEMVLVVLVPLFNSSNAAAWQKQLEQSFVKDFAILPGKASIKITLQKIKKSVQTGKNKREY